ncbi:BglG family transcription antiterminator [Clostridium sp. D53t1_180928_C8]|uniref:BglG family transcription antiterminator n=1 Tax=Clostridium sp. D53t1_180928_C8 TaxID=2787101 RepID=UPI0018AA2EEE|nr:BglG family transcription antiterminator [Clostridium sp. D53t1_180928_C8]
MIILNKRQIEITNFLENKLEWITIENIAKTFDVSERTIRNDLDSIGAFLQENNIELERKPRLGVKINLKRNQSINHILKGCTNKLYTADDRVIMIAIILLVRNSTTIEKLSEYIQVSKNTLVNDLKVSEEILNKLNIEVSKKAYYGITIKENNYEKLANAFSILFNKLEDRYGYEIYKILYENSNLNKNIIRNIIEAIEENKGIQYTEEAYEELERILLLTICKSINSSNEINDSKDDLLTEESIFLKESIEKFSLVRVSDEKILYLIKLFRGSKRAKYIIENQEEVDSVVKEIVDELCEILNIKVEDDNEFLMQMAMHLNVAIYRLKNNLIINNPMLEEIKYKMSFIYDVTEQVLNNKKDVVGIEFPEAEIAYMAMYFETLFEKYVKGNLNSKVLIVCNGGLATSSLLKSRINLMIPEIAIEGICRLKDVNDYLVNSNIDFIVTTVPLQLNEYKVIKVNPLLEIEDLERIKAEIYNKWYEKNCKYLVKKVKSENITDIAGIIPEKYAQFNLAIEDWREAIKVASQPLLDSKKIKQAYISDMIRVVETLGNYMVFIPEIAFVHAPPENVVDNGVSLLTLKEPLEFGVKNKVFIKAIVVLANKEESKSLVSLVNILMKNDNIDKFKFATEYEEIKKIV